MQGCPWCTEMKKVLGENKIKFIPRDIEEHKEEYDLFVEATGNEYVPAFLILEHENGENITHHMLVPEKDYDSLEEALEKIQKIIL